MKTILVFRTGTLGTWREKLGGVTAFAKAKGWRVQTIDARAAAPDIRALCAFWRPDGVLLDVSGPTDGLDVRALAARPLRRARARTTTWCSPTRRRLRSRRRRP